MPYILIQSELCPLEEKSAVNIKLPLCYCALSVSRSFHALRLWSCIEVNWLIILRHYVLNVIVYLLQLPLHIQDVHGFEFGHETSSPN
jgi:hypothetical protein